MTDDLPTNETLDDAATLLWHIIQYPYENDTEIPKEDVKALTALYGLMHAAARKRDAKP